MAQYFVFQNGNAFAFETEEDMSLWLDDVWIDSFTIGQPENAAWLQYNSETTTITATYVTAGWRFISVLVDID